MKKYNLITPEGTRDLLFEESLALRNTENKLYGLFKSFGYTEVITPAIEFYDVFNSKVRYFSQESLYKLSDGKGRLIVLRPDSTMPIARLAATRLRDERIPLKLFYSQNIFKVNPKNSGRDDEISQSGIEIIGGDKKRSDFEAVSIALEVLEELDISKKGSYRLEIGNCGFFKQLISMLPLNISKDGAITEEIRLFVETKNYPELNRIIDSFKGLCDKWIITALRALPELFGGSEIFDRAYELFKDNEMRESLYELRELYREICGLDVSDKLTVDLGMVSKINYYTGIIFKGYIEGVGKSVLSGGRYDTLLFDFGINHPAIGFAVNISSSVLPPVDLKKPDILVFAENGAAAKGIKHIKNLINQGFTVNNALFPTFDDALRYGRAIGIHRLDIVGESSVKSIEI